MTPKIRRLLLVALLAGMLLPTPGRGYVHPTLAQEVDQEQPYRHGELLVKFTSSTALSALQTRAKQHLQARGASRAETITPLRIERWHVPEGQELALAAELEQMPGVEFAEPNYVAHALLTPSDEYYGDQWAHPMIGSPAAWDVTTGSADVTVAIVDTGVDLDHPEFQGRIVPGIDYAYDDNVPDDDNGHGTHVAGIAAAAGNNGTGVAGMAWNIRIMPVKVLNQKGSGSHDDIAQGIAWAVEHGAQIINLSLGGKDGSTTLLSAVMYAVNSGALLVVSAGNCGDPFTYDDNNCDYQDQPVYPAAYGETFAVAATTSADVTASYSNRNSYVDIAAPGHLIHSTVPGGYTVRSGTSQSAPLVSGLAALLLSADPDLTAEEIQDMIESTARDRGDPGWDIDYGHGRIDAAAALSSMVTLETPVLDAIDNADRDGDYDVTWSDVPFATQYLLEEDDNASFTSPTIVYNGSLTSAILLGRQTGTWYYRVRAAQLSTGKTSAWSDTVSVGVGLEAPTLSPINNDGQKTYRVSWNAVEGAAGYRLQESASAFFTSAAAYMTTTTHLDFENQPGGTWYYRVQAYTTGGSITSPWSAVQEVMVVPDAPASLTLTPSSEPDAYTLTWSSVAAAAGYRLLETTEPAGSPVTRYEGTATTYKVTGQPSGHWIYAVQAYNDAGDGAPSVSRDITVTMPYVATPVLAPIDNADRDRSYTVQWTGVTSATTYTLEESRSPWFETSALSHTTTLTQHTALDQPIGRWYYRVRARIGDDPSPWSTPASVLAPSMLHLPYVIRE